MRRAPASPGMATELLHSCSGSRYSIAKIDTAPLTEKGEEKEGCDVLVDDAERNLRDRIETFSPGQRAILGRAISLALAVDNCRRSGVARPTLVLDESDAGLDTENATAWVAMMRLAAEMVDADKVIFVSHSDEVVALADTTIVVADGKVEVRP